MARPCLFSTIDLIIFYRAIASPQFNGFYSSVSQKDINSSTSDKNGQKDPSIHPMILVEQRVAKLASLVKYNG